MVELLNLLLVLALVGLVVYLLVTYVPMAAPFKDLIIAVTAIALALWIIAALTGHASVPTVRVFR